jgi:hypothetical protein
MIETLIRGAGHECIFLLKFLGLGIKLSILIPDREYNGLFWGFPGQPAPIPMETHTLVFVGSVWSSLVTLEWLNRDRDWSSEFGKAQNTRMN